MNLILTCPLFAPSKLTCEVLGSLTLSPDIDDGFASEDVYIFLSGGAAEVCGTRLLVAEESDWEGFDWVAELRVEGVGEGSLDLWRAGGVSKREEELELMPSMANALRTFRVLTG